MKLLNLPTLELIRDEADALSKKHYPDLHVPRKKNVIFQCAVFDDAGKAVGVGYITLFAEVSIILDRDKPRNTLTKTWYMLGKRLLDKAKEIGLEKIYAFVDKPSGYAELLCRHFGARPYTGKTVLFRDLNEE